MICSSPYLRATIFNAPVVLGGGGGNGDESMYSRVYRFSEAACFRPFLPHCRRFARRRTLSVGRDFNKLRKNSGSGARYGGEILRYVEFVIASDDVPMYNFFSCTVLCSRLAAAFGSAVHVAHVRTLRRVQAAFPARGHTQIRRSICRRRRPCR